MRKLNAIIKGVQRGVIAVGILIMYVKLLVLELDSLACFLREHGCAVSSWFR